MSDYIQLVILSIIFLVCAYWVWTSSRHKPNMEKFKGLPK